MIEAEEFGRIVFDIIPKKIYSYACWQSAERAGKKGAEINPIWKFGIGRNNEPTYRNTWEKIVFPVLFSLSFIRMITIRCNPNKRTYSIMIFFWQGSILKRQNESKILTQKQRKEYSPEEKMLIMLKQTTLKIG